MVEFEQKNRRFFRRFVIFYELLNSGLTAKEPFCNINHFPLNSKIHPKKIFVVKMNRGIWFIA